MPAHKMVGPPPAITGLLPLFADYVHFVAMIKHEMTIVHYRAVPSGGGGVGAVVPPVIRQIDYNVLMVSVNSAPPPPEIRETISTLTPAQKIPTSFPGSSSPERNWSRAIQNLGCNE